MTDREQKAFAELVAVCRRLRGPDGCPWDREQTLESMTPYLTEEAVESSEAIASGESDHIAEELGDLAFLSIFCLELLGERSGHRDQPRASSARPPSSSAAIPHVYGSTEIKDGEAAYRQWQEIKKQEKGEKAASLLGEQPKGCPRLVAAYRMQEKAGAVGFDWPDASGALAKIREETGEIEEEMKGDHRSSARARGRRPAVRGGESLPPSRRGSGAANCASPRIASATASITSSAASPSAARLPRKPRWRRWTRSGRRPRRSPAARDLQSSSGDTT
jgi:NTP pyrophosphatase (non-canonical NTP hydrolase)